MRTQIAIIVWAWASFAQAAIHVLYDKPVVQQEEQLSDVRAFLDHPKADSSVAIRVVEYWRKKHDPGCDLPAIRVNVITTPMPYFKFDTATNSYVYQLKKDSKPFLCAKEVDRKHPMPQFETGCAIRDLSYTVYVDREDGSRAEQDMRRIVLSALPHETELTQGGHTDHECLAAGGTPDRVQNDEGGEYNWYFCFFAQPTCPEPWTAAETPSAQQYKSASICK